MNLGFLEEHQDLILRVLNDVKGVSGYAHIGLAIAFMYVAVYTVYAFVCWIFKRERKLGTDHAVAMFMLLIYMTSLIYIVLMSRETGQYSGVNTELWSSWGRTTTTRAYFIENILLFVPMGLLMPAAFRSFRNPLICITSVCLFSCFIETVQYIFGLGVAEIDDVITNTAGGVIGLLIYAFLWLFHVAYVNYKGYPGHYRKKKRV